jgi:trimeric autotransporter adhesin
MLNCAQSRRMCRPAAAAVAVILCAGGVASAQWQGPFTPNARVEYTGGNVYVGPASGWNQRIRFGVNEPGDTTRDITLYGFAGTPPSQVRTTAIWGETNNPAGRGLQGFNFATSGTAEGIWAETASTVGTGLRARATAATGANYAAFLDTLSTGGTAVFGTATATTGTTYGVWGNVASTSGYAGYFTGGRNYFQGNVGIGNTAPAFPLHIGSGNGGSTPRAWMTNGMFASPGVENDGMYVGTKTEGPGRVDAIIAWGDDPFDTLRFIYSESGGAVDGSERMRITGAGNVGIGTADPQTRLHVNGDIRLPTTVTIGGTIANGNTGITTIQAAGNASSFGSATQGGELRLRAGNGNSAASQAEGTSIGNDVIIVAGDNVFNAGNSALNNGNIRFVAGDAQSNGGIQPERMRIVGDNGNVGIGTSNPTTQLQVVGTVNAITISAVVKNFKIDHPLDPENKYLYHASVESDEAANIYSGNVMTDGGGFATVTMPGWFEALNENFRYQLTIVDDGGQWAQARVVRKMDNGSFVIQTSVPQIEVSWLVMGTRKDAFMRANPMQVEVAKPESERGQYLTPEAFGLPETRRVGFRPPQALREVPTQPDATATPAAQPKPANRQALPQPAQPPRAAPKSNEPPLKPAIFGAGRQ